MRVFISGPYTKGDVAVSVARAMEVAHRLMDAGHIPFTPHLSHFLHLHRARPYEEWIAQDLHWLPLCEAIVRLDGESAGAEREVEEAIRLGIPIMTLETLCGKKA
jgi:hypothetical protein